MGRIQREENTVRLPLLGKIKVGEKVSKGDKEYPVSLDYFRATGKYSKLFHDVYGEKPSKITVVFVSDAQEDSCDERYEFRDKSGALVAFGDGKYWGAWKGEEYQKGEATLEKMIEAYGEPKASLTLKFILPKLKGVFGLWQFQTFGIETSIPAIRDSFDQVQEMAGTVKNIPFDLQVEKVKTQKPGLKRIYPVVNLIANVSQENLLILRDFIDEGENIRGMLTEERIESMSKNVKLLEGKKEK